MGFLIFALHFLVAILMCQREEEEFTRSHKLQPVATNNDNDNDNWSL